MFVSLSIFGLPCINSCICKDVNTSNNDNNDNSSSNDDDGGVGGDGDGVMMVMYNKDKKR